MSSARETVLIALHNLIVGAAVSGEEVLRNEPLPDDIPSPGVLIVRDGDPGNPDVTMSPVTYHYEHRAEIEAIVQHANSATRDTNFDDLLGIVGLAVASDTTLGGLCDWLEIKAPAPVDLPSEGAAAIKAAVIPVMIYYSTSDPLA